MATEAQIYAIACTIGGTCAIGILANRRLGRRIVLNLGHFDFEIVSDFDIRISDFNHSGCFMQNKPNLMDTQMNVSTVLTKDYERNDVFAVPENKANSNPIKPNTNPKQSQFPKSQNELKLLFNKGL